MARKQEKSKAQQRLAELLEETYPYAKITQEVFIKDLIAKSGYKSEDLERELGHKIHKMFVDIVVYSSEFIAAYEYHGEQHYRQIGNMTKTSSSLAMNQMLDEEKAWVLRRIGMPIITIPFDMYYDSKTLQDMLEQEIEETQSLLLDYYPCDACGRRYRKKDLIDDLCQSCNHERIAELEWEIAEYKPVSIDEYGYVDETDYSNEEAKKAWREKQKQKRKEERERYKASPEYQRHKEEMRNKRKEAYRKRKEEMKANKKMGE